MIAEPAEDRRKNTARLTRLTFAAVEQLIRRTLPELTRNEPDIVAYVPRGGAVPGALIAQYAGIDLTSEPSDCRGKNVLLVEDLCVTGGAIERFRARLDAAREVTTFSLVRVNGAGEFVPDLWGYATGPGEYVMVPWEITDIFDDDYPFDVTSELDGVLRDRNSGRRLLRADRVATVATNVASFDADRRWTADAGIEVTKWLVLDGPSSDADLENPLARRPCLYLCGSRPSWAASPLLSGFDVIFPISEHSQEGRGYAGLGEA